MGLGAAIGGAALIACFYLFDPLGRIIVIRHRGGVLAVVVSAFAIGFAATLPYLLWLGSEDSPFL